MPTRSEALQTILNETIQEGVAAMVLTTEEGLPLAVSDGDGRAEGEILAAIAPIFQRAAERSGRPLSRLAEEMVMRSPSGALVVCRFLTIDDKNFILAALVPKGQAYRRTMNRAVRQIQRIWHQKRGEQAP